MVNYSVARKLVLKEKHPKNSQIWGKKIFRQKASLLSFSKRLREKLISSGKLEDFTKCKATHTFPLFSKGCPTFSPKPSQYDIPYHQATLSRPHYSKASHVEGSSGGPTLWWSETIGALNKVQQRSVWKEEFVLEGPKQWGRQSRDGPSHLPWWSGLSNHVAIIVSCY